MPTLRVTLAIATDNINGKPTLFKTYDTSTVFASCTISQAAQVTSAATNLLKSLNVTRHEIESVNTGFCYSKPCEILVEEGWQYFPEGRQMRVLSVEILTT
ncbi:hypothetical protein CIHG_06430 [Coccidioides immitis H538.4]|uniref:Uncharacterized protein n=1 Tax=Coccidioides immitis H538.4 TaxID=396776 RepID=A0A0J8RVE4_COCIT|nr:hypothetical protein CIHG_06430 [Coccidioides immitis H538.4]